MDSDTTAIWEDLLALLEQRGETPSLIAMLNSCTPMSFEQGCLTISTGMSFARQSLLKKKALLDSILSEVCFEPAQVEIILVRENHDSQIATRSVLTQEEIQHFDSFSANTAGTYTRQRNINVASRRERNPLVERISVNDSELTFDKFVEGEENQMAFSAAKQVANGMNKNFNPLFIYGRSGVGKTHLLKAIYNYIYQNDPSRICVYKSSREFLGDFQEALNAQHSGTRGSVDALTHHYQDIDVLIIDDFQWLTEKNRTIEYFFDIFNYLTMRDKQIVIAADRQPNQLGMDERVISRLASGFPVSIQTPDYELKLSLVKNFYTRTKEDAALDKIPGYEGTISQELLEFMAEKAGTNIRIIKTFCQKCIVVASERKNSGLTLTKEDVLRVAKESFPSEQKVISIEQIQRAVEEDYAVHHKDLIGNKRSKEVMEPRHVAIWLCRGLTDFTLADIGSRFGRRTHATVKHSIEWVDERCQHDRLFFDRVVRLSEHIQEG